MFSAFRFALPITSGLLLAGLGGGCSQRPGVAQRAPTTAVPVTVQPVVYSAASVPVEAAGILGRQAETELAFKSSGVVGEVSVRSGDAVQQGQILARLQLDEIEAAVTQARAIREKAHRDLTRARQLLETKVYTLEQVQNFETVASQADAALQSAEFNARHAVIVAPADGRILRRRAEPHQTLLAGTPVLDFASEGDGWLIRVGLSERDVQRIYLQDTVDWAIDGHLQACQGHVVKIAEAIDPASRTTEVEIRVASQSEGIRSGFVTHVTIHPTAGTPRPLIPAAAIVEGQGRKATVFTVENGLAHRVPIDASEWLDDQIFLLTPIPAGTSLVVVGAEFLRDGMPVTPVDAPVALH